MELTRDIHIARYENGEVSESEDMVVREYALTILLDGEEFITLLCSPSSLDCLVTGFLLSESIIKSKADIDRIRLDEERGIADVLTYARGSLAKSLHGKRMMTTGCGKGSSFYNAMDSLHCRKVTEGHIFSAQTVLDLMKAFNKSSELFRDTGGVHSVALTNSEGIVLFHEDVGRHNAMDKVIGEAAIKEVGLSDKIILTSGRVSSEMLIKASKAGIPAIVSRSAPTDLAVELAERLGITVVGFARGNRMNVYSCPERVKL
ncbi:MAG TPA: formate dehydrogenase accessory sulfurtransferase FdhD [Negativicutes bacterium]|nr:formate dehydrogenase accessory sulfurtransferase FdhD [Negativicutes bacterium]